MALKDNALVSVADLKGYLGGLSGPNKDEALERAINSASSIVQEHLGRKLVDASLLTPWTRTEYHSVYSTTHELWLVDWPIVSITSVSEDAGRAYSTTLTVDEDYIVDKPQGKLLRVQSGAGAVPWLTGFEAIKVVGVLGYKDHTGKPDAAGTVPSDIADACLWIAARTFHENEKRQYDVQSQTSAEGTVTRFSSNRLPPMIQALLASHRARLSTGRRAA